MPKREYDFADRPDLWVRRACEVCGVVCTNDVEWGIHERGQRHKKRVSRERRRPEVEAFIRMRREKEEGERRGLERELVDVLEGVVERGGEGGREEGGKAESGDGV